MKTIFKIAIGIIGITAGFILGIFWYLSPILKPFPKPTGHYAIGTMLMELKDLSRKEKYSPNSNDIRDLMIRIWYPSAIQEAQKGSNNPYFYLSDEIPYYVALLGAHFRIPQWLAKRMISNIKTHAYIDASLATDQSSYPIILFSHGLLG